MAAGTGPGRAICKPERLEICDSTYNLTLSRVLREPCVLVANGASHRVEVRDRQTGAGEVCAESLWTDGETVLLNRCDAIDAFGNSYIGK